MPTSQSAKSHNPLNSFFYGLYYYAIALSSAAYVVGRAFLSWSVHWVYNKQAQRRHWHGLSDLPSYQHERLSGKPEHQRHHTGDPPSQSAGMKHSATSELLASGKHWGIDQVPIERHTFTTKDGLEVTYYVMYPGNPKLQVLCNGLGVNANYTGFLPVIYRYGKVGGDYSFITWDYRGLFNNGPVNRKRRLAIHYHASDLNEILEKEKRSHIDVLYGFSMGVQVALEFAVTEPEKVKKMVLLNGAHGNVLRTLYQPFFPIPGMATYLYYATKLVTKNIPLMVAITRAVGYYQIVAIGHVYSLFFGSPFLRELLGNDYLIRFFIQYLSDTIASPQHSANYMQSVYEMNAHSCYHLLSEIETPTLIVTGLLDPFTPAYLSFQMYSLMPNSRLFYSPLSSHFTLLERPRETLGAIIGLIEGDATEWLKVNSKDYHKYKRSKSERPSEERSSEVVHKKLQPLKNELKHITSQNGNGRNNMQNDQLDGKKV